MMLLKLKNAVENLATSCKSEIYELCLMLEGNKEYGEFGKKHAMTAYEIYKELFYSGTELRVSLLAVAKRCRECTYDIEKLEFWEDLSLIVSLYEALKSDGYYDQKPTTPSA